MSCAQLWIEAFAKHIMALPNAIMEMLGCGVMEFQSCCRYELEKELMEGTVSVPDLPRIWNERMTSYLGCTPKDDAQGVLQASSLTRPYFWQCSCPSTPFPSALSSVCLI